MSNTEPDMKLPEGKTCKDCANVDWCKKVYGVKEHYTVCDFAPSRFKKNKEDYNALNRFPKN